MVSKWESHGCLWILCNFSGKLPDEENLCNENDMRMCLKDGSGGSTS